MHKIMKSHQSIGSLIGTNLFEICVGHPRTSHRFKLLLAFLVTFACAVAFAEEDQPSMRPKLVGDELAKIEQVNQKLQQVGRQLQKLEKMLDREQKILDDLREKNDKIDNDQVEPNDEKIMQHEIRLINILFITDRLTNLKNDLQDKFNNLKSLELLQLQIDEYTIKCSDKKLMIKEIEDQMSAAWSRLIEAEFKAKVFENSVVINQKWIAEYRENHLMEDKKIQGPLSNASLEKTIELAIENARESRASANLLRLQRKEMATKLYQHQDELLDLTVKLKLLQEKSRVIEKSKPDWDKEIIDENFDALINDLEEIEVG